MIRKGGVHVGDVDFRHMARDALLGCDVVSWEAVMREWHFAQAALPANSFRLAGLRRGHQPGSARWSSVESCARPGTDSIAKRNATRANAATERRRCLLAAAVFVIDEDRLIVFMDGLGKSIALDRNARERSVLNERSAKWEQGS